MCLVQIKAAPKSTFETMMTSNLPDYQANVYAYHNTYLNPPRYRIF
jgi:hypothetical protein